MAAYKLIPFEPEHALRLELQHQTPFEYEMVWDEAPWHRVREEGIAWTVTVDDEIAFTMGVVRIWPGRALAWFMGDESLGSGTWMHRTSVMLRATRRATRMLDEVQDDPEYRRIEASVREDYKQGHQWARMLGFELEGLMRCYDQQGNNHAMYARVI